MTFISAYLITGLAVLIFMTILWIVSLIIKNTSIVDIFWGLGFVFSGWVYFLNTPDGFLGRKLLLMILVTIWGLRLSIHVFIRNKGKGEDFRYAKWREEHGKNWWWYSFFQTFLLQGILMWLISIPLLAAQFSPFPARITVLDILAVIIWGIGFFFEAAGDYQLSKFKSDPSNKGKVLDQGVWHYTRHPNYFGDSAQWFGYYLFALATISGFWTIYSPVIMTYLLLRVSGVALLEKTLKDTKPQYKEYIENTSPFIPWFPKKK